MPKPEYKRVLFLCFYLKPSFFYLINGGKGDKRKQTIRTFTLRLIQQRNRTYLEEQSFFIHFFIDKLLEVVVGPAVCVATVVQISTLCILTFKKK